MLNNDESISPTRPHARETYPKGPVAVLQRGSLRVSLLDIDLTPEGKVLGGKMRHKIEFSQYSTQAISEEYEHHWTLRHRPVKFNSRNE